MITDLYKTLLLAFIVMVLSIPVVSQPFKGNACLRISFENIAEGKKVVLNDSAYTNPFGEKYIVTKLKYYVSNVNLNQDTSLHPAKNCFLIDEKNETRIELDILPGNYTSLSFLLGVDSVRNFSGVQSGALDPVNDMFWTWNSGYVVYKMEGRSDSSKADLNRIEYHIGGYKGNHNTSVPVTLSIPGGINVPDRNATEITLMADLDQFWDSNFDLRISKIPVCINPGSLAKNISANFSRMFSIKESR